MPLTATENKFLNELIKDCITYGLQEKEALEYFETRFKPVSLSAYKHRKAKVLSEDGHKIWLNHYTRIGFVQHHKQQMDTIQLLQNDSLRQLFMETQKQQDQRDEDKILKLKQDIRDNTKFLSELGLGTPIIGALKSKLQQLENYRLGNLRDLDNFSPQT